MAPAVLPPVIYSTGFQVEISRLMKTHLGLAFSQLVSGATRSPSGCDRDKIKSGAIHHVITLYCTFRLRVLVHVLQACLYKIESTDDGNRTRNRTKIGDIIDPLASTITITILLSIFRAFGVSQMMSEIKMTTTLSKTQRKKLPRPSAPVTEFLARGCTTVGVQQHFAMVKRGGCTIFGPCIILLLVTTPSYTDEYINRWINRRYCLTVT